MDSSKTHQEQSMAAGSRRWTRQRTPHGLPRLLFVEHRCFGLPCWAFSSGAALTLEDGVFILVPVSAGEKD